MKQFAIIGLSNFGKAMLEEFSRVDCELLVIDKNRELVESIKDKVTSALIADAINEETINRLIPNTIDAAIIDLGDSVEVSILVTHYLKKMGVKHIVAKADSPQHGEILEVIGAETVVFPNREAAKRLGPMIYSDALLGYFPLSKDLVIAEVKLQKKMSGKTVIDADLRRKSGLNIIALRHEDDYEQIIPSDYILQEDEILLVSGSPEDIERYSGDKLFDKNDKKRPNGIKQFFQ